MQITSLALKAFIASTVLTLFAVNVEVGRERQTQVRFRSGTGVRAGDEEGRDLS